MVEVEKVIEHVLQIEIDYHAYIRFTGFNKLVDQVAGVSVKIPTAIKDPKFWDDPNKPRGIYFPQSNSWLVKGSATACNGLYRTRAYTGQPGYRCEKALVFARTRKGTGNSDFKRAKRHQNLTFAAVQKVRQRGKSNLGSLVNALLRQQSAGDFYTNIPLNLAHAETLFSLAAGAYMDRQVVLKPTKYATRISGTAYKLKLNLSAVRTLTRSWFARVP
jgi:anionic cell wall polymer biosynthesis LytR-Cps2A-Psr (LCP) family protein